MLGSFKIYAGLGAVIALMGTGLYFSVQATATEKAKRKAAETDRDALVELLDQRQAQSDRAQQANVTREKTNQEIGARADNLTREINRSEGDACTDSAIPAKFRGVLNTALYPGAEPAGAGGGVAAVPDAGAEAGNQP